MFKSINVFRISPDWPPMLAVSEDRIKAQAFTPCAPSQDSSIGWVEPRGEANGPMVEAIDGQWILMFQTEKKAVPGALLKRRVDERAAQIEKETGRKPGKKERKQLKEDIVLELLPMAFPSIKQIPVWINTQAAMLVIGTSSSTQADLIVTALVRSLEGFAVEMYNTQQEPGSAMSAWLATREAPPKFDIGRTCEMRQPVDGGAVVRYKNHPLDVDEVAAHAAEMRTTSLHLTWDDRVSFALHDDFSVRSISFLEGVGDAAGKAADNFDADMAIATGELKLMMADLTECLGGLTSFAPTSGPADGAVATAARAFEDSARNMGSTVSIETGGKVIATFGEGPDPMYEQALAVVKQHKKASISIVQRHLKIGYNRAARLVEAMETAGVVSSMNTEGQREIL